MIRLILTLLAMALTAPAAVARMSAPEQTLAAHDCSAGDKAACIRAFSEAALPFLELNDAQPEMQAAARAQLAEADAACTAGTRPACNTSAALRHMLGEADLATLYDTYAESCDRGDGSGCARLSDMSYNLALDFDGSMTRYYDTLGPFCAAGDQIACTSQARLNALLQTVLPERSIWYDQLVNACDAAVGRACVQLSYIYSVAGEDEYKALDPTLYASSRLADRRSANYGQRACALGNSVGCWNIGLAYDYGEGVREDWRTAQAYFVKACRGGFAPACDELNYESYWRKSDPLPELRAACESGDFTACLFLAERENAPILRNPETEADKARMTRHKDQLIALCHDGHVGACGFGAHMLGNVFAETDLAERYARAACDMQDGNGCVILGALIEDGHASDGKVEQAMIFYEQACMLENWSGCNDLGSLLRKAPEPLRDEARATRMFQIACTNRLAIGCNNLAVTLRKSDPERASRAKERACELSPERYCE